MSPPKIIFVATEDWFVASHFRPLLKRAVEDGFEVIVAARDSGALTNEPSVRFVAMPFARRALAPGDVWCEVRALKALLRAERPQVVHAIALKPIALAVLADATRTIPSVLALTGRGYLEARGGWRRLVLEAIAARMRAAIANGAFLLTENEADQRWVSGGSTLPAARMMMMPGAGVDPEAFKPVSEPSESPIIVGLAARLVRSKGVDVAVDAINRLRRRGLEIELRVAGAVDPDNPERIDEATLAAWRAMPAIHLLGRTSDISGFWAGAHIGCLPSRGGEGLPRALLEAASCGRPIVTTATPGCSDFVSDEMGFVAPLDDVASIAEAIAILANDAQKRHRMGMAARARVLSGYTETHAAEVASEAWRRCVGLAGKRAT